MVLAPRVIGLLDCPVVVSGGLCDGRGLAAMLASKPPEQFQEWEEGEMRRAMREGDIENGLLPAGQIAAAVTDVPTAAARSAPRG
jgi:NAD(P)H-dependent flavin oxidoreductase YrpB (nitropropane dioxygenase family)